MRRAVPVAIDGNGHWLLQPNLQRGFSFLEVMTAIVIAAILAMIAIPSFTILMTKYRLNGATRQVFSDLMAARMKAITLNRRVQVFFLGDNRTYKICDDANGDGNVLVTEGDVQTRDIQGNYFSVTLGSTGDPVFEPRGTTMNSRIVTVTNSSGSKTIRVDASGGVRIE
jgi:prepilin-type N-terminal cleavage/methylation domain-containing protein